MTDTATPHSAVEDDPGMRAQRAAEQHLVAIWDAEDALDENPDDPDIEYPASAPWDGCDTCVVREVLYAAWPIIEGHFTTTATQALRDAGHHEAAELVAKLIEDQGAGS